MQCLQVSSWPPRALGLEPFPACLGPSTQGHASIWRNTWSYGWRCLPRLPLLSKASAKGKLCWWLLLLLLLLLLHACQCQAKLS